MHLVMAGEWQFSSSIWNYVLDTESLDKMMEGDEKPSGMSVWLLRRQADVQAAGRARSRHEFFY